MKGGTAEPMVEEKAKIFDLCGQLEEQVSQLEELVGLGEIEESQSEEVKYLQGLLLLHHSRLTGLVSRLNSVIGVVQDCQRILR